MQLRPLLRNTLAALKGRFYQPPLTPREKAHTLITALAETTTACLTEQAHLFGYGRRERYDALNTLADNFASGEWVPEGLASEDMRLIGPGIISDVVHRIAQGYGIAGYEIKIHEIFQSQTMPEVRSAGNDDRPLRNKRRAYYHV